MKPISAIRYDGQSSAGQSVELTFYSDSTVGVKGEGISATYRLEEINIPSQVGGVHARLEFPDDSLCEVSDSQALHYALPDTLKKGFWGRVHRWESSLKYALFALVIAGTIIWAGIEFVLPGVAKQVAENIPLEWEKAMGEQTLASLEKVNLLSATELTQERQNELLAKFNSALEKANAVPLSRIEFRKSEALDANAIALPSGILVFTDAMVEFAEDDRELIGILGHELGHIEHRHSMRHVLQNSALALLLIMITGDVGSASTLATTMPLILAEAKFSRQFEVEADAFSIGFMQKLDLDTRYLSNILQRLGEKYGDSGSTGYFDSHPSTRDRVKSLAGG